MDPTQPAARTTSWRWIAALWCAFGTIEATQAIGIMRFGEGRDHAWLPLFAISLATWLPWALATPWIIGLARRHRLHRRVSVRTILVHLAAFAIISVIAEAWSAVLQVMFNPWGNRQAPTFWGTWSITLLYQALIFLIAYVLILIITYLVDSRESLSKAQLAALRGQMEPHFMFNTLNSIAGLVRDRRNDEAVSMIVGLSEFLRRASEDSHRSQVTLAEEVEYLQRYVDIQQVRFGERLRVTVDIEKELLNAQVPNLLLQPLVENAIKHGIAKRVTGGTVRVAGARRNGSLYLSVYNDGPNFPDEWQTKGAGVGLANLRTRLQILHGDASELRMTRVGTDGVEVVVALPLKEA
jgi:two-component system, LytTR family, sensor kinase